MSAPGFFVSGTDTGAGKTVAACGLVRALRARGIDTGAMKAMETGVGPEGPLDGLALQAAAGGHDPLEDVCPLRFALPASPDIAAASEGRRIDLDLLDEAFDRLASRHAAVVVEGAGGLLVPVVPGVDMVDLARRLRLPIVLVARSALGTINHTRLSLEAVEARGLDVAGVVISHATGVLSEADAANLDGLRRRLGERLIGEIPPLADGAEAGPEHFRLERLLGLLR